MKDLVLIKTDFYELRMTYKGEFYRYDLILHDVMLLTDIQAKGMMLLRVEEINK